MDDDVREISFEHLEGGKWERIEDDPEDDELEIVHPVEGPGAVYSQIQRLKARGWQVRQDVDPSFDGFVLFKEKGS